MIRLRVLACVVVVTACGSGGSPGADSVGAGTADAAAQPATAPFEDEIRQFGASDRAQPPQTGGVLFVGSSSIRMWGDLARDFPDIPVLNRGFGGSTLPDVIHFADRIVLPYRPRLIVLYAGDNDLANGRTPAQVLADYRTFVALVRRELPATRVIFVSIKPSPSRWDIADRMRVANRMIRAESAGDSLAKFVDVFTPMLAANGHPRPEYFLDDSLHMTRAGYDLWRARLRRLVR